jgi:putative membrane protein
MGDDFPRGRTGGARWGDAYWGRMHDGMGWGGWLLLLLLLVFLAALVVVVVVLVVRAASGSPSQPGAGGRAVAGPSAAQQVLDERFARGEIDEEEYLRRRSVLRGGG